MTSLGTPKSLTEAILNGMRDSFDQVSQKEKIRVVREHVKDYLAQKFTSVTLKNPEIDEILQDLFQKSTLE